MGRGRPKKIQPELLEDESVGEIFSQSVKYEDEVVTFYYDPKYSKINPVESVIETISEYSKRIEKELKKKNPKTT